MDVFLSGTLLVNRVTLVWQSSLTFFCFETERKLTNKKTDKQTHRRLDGTSECAKIRYSALGCAGQMALPTALAAHAVCQPHRRHP